VGCIFVLKKSNISRTIHLRRLLFAEKLDEPVTRMLEEARGTWDDWDHPVGISPFLSQVDVTEHITLWLFTIAMENHHV
jgi:hypothetical protein